MRVAKTANSHTVCCILPDRRQPLHTQAYLTHYSLLYTSGQHPGSALRLCPSSVWVKQRGRGKSMFQDVPEAEPLPPLLRFRTDSENPMGWTKKTNPKGRVGFSFDTLWSVSDNRLRPCEVVCKEPMGCTGRC